MVLDIIKRRISYISIWGRGKNIFGKEKNSLDIEYVLKLIANYGFPLVLSLYLVYKLEFFINEIIKNQKEFSQNITAEIKEIKQAINELRVDFAKNKWNLWYIRVLVFLKKASKIAYIRRIYKIRWIIPANLKQGLKTRL